jgi:hypothetical protein
MSSFGTKAAAVGNAEDVPTDQQAGASDAADHGADAEEDVSTTEAHDGTVYPRLVVLDLDDCVWHPEMYTLNQIPEQKVMGKHHPSDDEECVVG